MKGKKNPAGPGGQEFSLSIANSVPGQNCRGLGADNLISPDWQVVSGTNAGGLFSIEIPILGTDRNLFYKLETWRQ